jgi:thymidylate synthase ThyX
MIQAKIVADSLTERGHRLTTMEVVMPRYILAEFNTHRMLSKNSASSRAIPLRKMLLSVMYNPFIPYAWQENHKGMQGTKYLNTEYLFGLHEFLDKAKDFFYSENKEDNEKLQSIYLALLTKPEYLSEKTLKDWWLLARDKALEIVAVFGIFGLTKQLANRLLEPFMYHKVLVSATEWENFSNLRCPSYTFHNDDSTNDFVYKSRKEAIKDLGGDNPVEYPELNVTLGKLSTVQWLELNAGQADIHMMELAECIYDAIKESTPTKLKEGEWHIPYGDNLNEIDITQVWTKLSTKENVISITELKAKISIARCARLSYQTLGDNPVIDYEADLKLYDTLYNSGHASPAEHIARAMTEEEHNSYVKGKASNKGTDLMPMWVLPNEAKGWCRNYRGFIMYRELLD